MINELNEGHENGKSCLPGPCVLLWFVVLLRRVPLPRVSPRGCVVGSPTDGTREGVKVDGPATAPTSSLPLGRCIPYGWKRSLRPIPVLAGPVLSC